MNSKERKTLATIFKEPVSGSIAWADVESPLLAAGCQVIDGNGSRVRFRPRKPSGIRSGTRANS